MEVADLSSHLQRLGLLHKSAVSLEKTEPNYVLDMAAQQNAGADCKLAVTSSNHTIRILSRSRLAQSHKLTGHTDVISGVKFLHQDPELLVTSSHDRTVRVWDSRSSSTKEAQTFKGENNTNVSFLSCDVSVTDRVICAGAEKRKDGTYLLFWDRRKEALLGCYEDSHDDDILQVKFHPVTEKLLQTGSTDGLVNVFDIMQASEDDALLSTYNTESSVETCGWCGPEARYVYCITHMGTWHVWDSKDDEDVEQVTDVQDRLDSEHKVDYLVDCIPSGVVSENYLLVAGSHTGDLHFLHMSGDTKASIITTLKGGHSDTVRCLHWDGGTETLVTGGEDSLLCLWSPDSDKPHVVSTSKEKGKSKKQAKKSKPYAR